jgi:HPt (histidine-containing phosphotransfer) domain-containing protein
MESNPVNPPSVSAMLDELWLKFRPQIEERVVVLEQAAAALAQDNLSPALCAEAQSAAHKLAGSLGTFGFMAGGEMAREAESMYQSNPSRESAAHLNEIAAALRAIVLPRH